MHVSRAQTCMAKHSTAGQVPPSAQHEQAHSGHRARGGRVRACALRREGRTVAHAPHGGGACPWPVLRACRACLSAVLRTEGLPLAYVLRGEGVLVARASRGPGLVPGLCSARAGRAPARAPHGRGIPPPCPPSSLWSLRFCRSSLHTRPATAPTPTPTPSDPFRPSQGVRAHPLQAPHRSRRGPPVVAAHPASPGGGVAGVGRCDQYHIRCEACCYLRVRSKSGQVGTGPAPTNCPVSVAEDPPPHGKLIGREFRSAVERAPSAAGPACPSP
ncbi:hypothetical protein HNP84_003779 [Thermocatellispora tengchongensis]|uniref:Uncharacterized protein n=1 Tax=Thermocatellispora tengchongensis TaxID=1073253 RepID=A0A840P806_9ACTN|nr:hypothetical protein [Thermocatellispora tengchongensis]